MKVIYEKREVITRIFFRTLMCLFLLALLLGTLYQAKTLLPDSTHFQSGNITFEMLENARDSCPSLIFGGCQETTGTMTPDPMGNRLEPVTLRFVDTQYFNLLGIDLVAGSTFDLANPVHVARAVLISEDLACRLFFTQDAVGRELTVDGQIRTVVGVYAESKTFLSRISGSGAEVLYLPYSSESTGNSIATHILVGSASGSMPEGRDLSILDAKLGQQLLSGTREDLSLWQNNLTDLVRLYLFALAIIFTIVQIPIITSRIKHFGEWYHTQMNHEEISKKEILHRLWFPVLCVLLCLTILSLTGFQFSIPVYFIPSDRHLLDISYYIDLFIEGLVKRNVATYEYFQAVYQYAIWIIHLVGLTLAILFTGLLKFWSKLMQAKNCCHNPE